ncbi:MAP kinase kinase MKK2/SSP33 [Mycena venus]|uniref:MAP kinase kinase MKK2/SSP33 n=1 Tax=Mycena venus TaxID=2733690 RepID=A0A8H7D448_9AGAR|nr:MAP kinase kinase MKK2/SSP33 [Mycena venus]
MASLIPNLTACTVVWGDDVLEEISRLGESGAVHKVKGKHCTGKIMVRKTIRTLAEGQMKQLLCQLSIISSIEYINIILFPGAYMLLSYEVKILLEFCESGSLEAVGTRIKELNAAIGENIAGRLAEGLCAPILASYKVSRILAQKKIIHRDIKPFNILLSREGIVKLCDIAISYELGTTFGDTLTDTTFFREDMWPKYTVQSDVWSTGMFLLELVQNRFPFPSDLPPIELMMHITSSNPLRLEDESDRQWSDDMKDFIKQMLTADALTQPTPKDMLVHPSVVSAMKQPDQMARWIRTVWGWPPDK